MAGKEWSGDLVYLTYASCLEYLSNAVASYLGWHSDVVHLETIITRRRRLAVPCSRGRGPDDDN